MLAPDGADSPAPALDPVGSLDDFLAAIERRAFRFAEYSLGNRDDALDAVQDSMIRLMDYRRRPAAEWTPLFWRILRSRIADARRRRLFRLRWLLPEAHGDSAMEWTDDAPDPSRAQDSREAWRQLAAALHDLPTRQREAFTLRVLEELDGDTTARIMGCSQGAVKTHLSRAREALQRQLEDFR